MNRNICRGNRFEIRLTLKHVQMFKIAREFQSHPPPSPLKNSSCKACVQRGRSSILMSRKMFDSATPKMNPWLKTGKSSRCRFRQKHALKRRMRGDFAGQIAREKSSRKKAKEAKTLKANWKGSRVPKKTLRWLPYSRIKTRYILAHSFDIKYVEVPGRESIAVYTKWSFYFHSMHNHDRAISVKHEVWQAICDNDRPRVLGFVIRDSITLWTEKRSRQKR